MLPASGDEMRTALPPGKSTHEKRPWRHLPGGTHPSSVDVLSEAESRNQVAANCSPRAQEPKTRTFHDKKHEGPDGGSQVQFSSHSHCSRAHSRMSSSSSSPWSSCSSLATRVERAERGRRTAKRRLRLDCWQAARVKRPSTQRPRQPTQPARVSNRRKKCFSSRPVASSPRVVSPSPRTPRITVPATPMLPLPAVTPPALLRPLAKLSAAACSLLRPLRSAHVQPWKRGRCGLHSGMQLAKVRFFS